VEGRYDSKRKSSKCANREQERSAGRECSLQDMKGDPCTDGISPDRKIVEQQLGAMMDGKQMLEKVTGNLEY
jgi:hypothetical protein